MARQPTSLGVKILGVVGFRHPVAIYDGVKNLLLVPPLIGALKMWAPGSGAATGCFLLGYGGLRFLVDQFRDYESSLFGIGPGQWFNLAMATIGLVVLLSYRKRTAKSAPVATTNLLMEKRQHLPLVTFAVLVALIVFPLCIPNSWTSEYLHLKRFQIQN